MSIRTMITTGSGLTALALACVSHGAAAQDNSGAGASASTAPDEVIIVTGTRRTDRTV